jgi:integrase
MLRDLFNWLRQKGKRSLAVLASVIFHTQGRGEEVMRTMVGDLQDDGGLPDSVVWLVRNDKRCRRGSRFQKVTEKLIPLNIARLMRMIGQNKKAGEVLFPMEEGCNLQELAREIKAAGVDLKWPTTVRFLGPHGLRHGGSGPLIRRATNALAQGMANQAETTLRHYARHNPHQ